MVTWISALLLATGLGVGLGIRHRLRRHELRARHRRVEQPNSHYAAPGVQRLIDRERWARIPLEQLHPLNRDEVHRVLRLVDGVGPDVLSDRERRFLDNMVGWR
jgi:hypothetical protein